MKNAIPLRYLLIAMLLGLAACTPSRPAPTVQDLMPTQKDFSAIASVETMVDSATSPDAPVSEDSKALRAQDIVGFGRYRYHLKAPDGGVYKVHILLFADEAAAIQNWQQRHHPQSLAATQPLPLPTALQGQAEGWIYPNAQQGEMSGLRLGRVVVEIKARGAASSLAGFTAALGSRAQRILKH